MKVLRSTLVAAAAMFAAACGDKVEIVQPGPAAAGINSVSVSPASVVMNVGQSVTFTAIVDATGGAATTVTWSSSGAGVTVTAGGVASATAATPGVAICATSTVDTGKRGCAQAVVAAANTVAPSVSISSVNFTNGAGVQQPAAVPPAGVAGQLNVVMNVNAGTAVLDSVVLKLGGKNAYKQSFTASQAAVLSTEAMEAIIAGGEQANQFGQQITASVNTADYSTTTGAATWQNGNQAFQAFIYGKNSVTAGGSPTNVQGNSPASTYRLANPDGFHVTVSQTQLTGGARTAGETQLASAVDAGGLGWKAGSLNVSALFVQYTPGITPIIVRANFNNIGCGPVGVAAKTLVLTNTGTGTPVAGPYTGTFNANPSTTGVTTVDDYEFSPLLGTCAAAATTGGGEILNMAAVGSDNNNIVLSGAARPLIGDGIGVLNAAATSLNPDPNLVLRLDNVGPGGIAWDLQSTNSASTDCATGTATTSMGGRTNCWLNDAVILNGRGTGFAGIPAASTSTHGVIIAGVDGGSGRLIGTADGITFSARVGLLADATATVDGNAAVTSVAGLAETAVPNAYRLRTRATDLIGNVTNTGSTTLGSAVASRFGVDRTAPVLAFVGGPAANARVAAYAANTPYTLGATDNAVAPAAPSGFFNLTAAPLLVSTQRRDAANGANFFYCVPTATYIAQPSTGGNPCGTTAGAGNAPAQFGWQARTNPAYFANLIVCDIYNPTAAIILALPPGPWNPCNLGGSTGALASAAPIESYNTTSATVDDQAGNRSAIASRVELFDPTASSIGGVSYPPFLIQGGTASFASIVNDALDIQLTRMNLQYGAVQPGAAGGLAATLIDGATGAGWAGATTALGGSTFWYPDAQVNGYNAATLVTTANMTNSVSSLMTNIQVTTASTTGAVGAGALNAAGVLNTANGIVLNQANTATGSATPIIAGALPATQTALAGGGGAGLVGTNWFICGTTATAPAAGVACPAVPAALAAATIAVSRDGTTAATNTSISFDAVVAGTTGVFNNPFSSVQFWAYDPTALTEGWRLIGTVTNAATVTDGGAAPPGGRNWHFNFTWDPNSVDAPTNAAVYSIMAVGFGGSNITLATSRGTAIATPIGGITVTMVP